MLKKMGFSKKENALQFPKEESYPKPPINYRVSFVDHLIRGLSPPIHEFLRGLLFIYGLQLHHLTPNSVLHISIFITLCECFLGVQHNWALWKRIFCIRRNSHHNVAYNIGGVVICVRSEVDYFDVKFPDSSKAGGKNGCTSMKKAPIPEENIALLTEKLKSFAAILGMLKLPGGEIGDEALMTRIHELQNTRKELSAESRPLPRHILFLMLRRGREMTKDSGTEEAEPSHKKAAFNPYTDALVSSDDEEELAVDATARTSTSRTLIVSEAQHDGDETSPPQQDIVQPPLVESPRASPSKGARIEPSKDSIQFPGGSSTPSLDDPLMKEFIRLGTQFVGYRDYTKKLEGDLAESNKRADALAVKLKQSEEARQKAEKDAATIEDLRKRLHNAETSLSNNITQQSAREAEILSRLESQFSALLVSS
ncbi:hypothetical protein QYE76_052198 [Lolium multiflorum]|uniref:Transposase (putative) gypsy type domain-containing protein n=1 Tax=Lolium multiflorum TaxID=4521 RepID=A0AAD8SUB0_LOLMU|nr:hypothetical protein QYE76_052198 [Lolium multiflorum]